MLNTKDIVQRSLSYVALITGLTVLFVGIAVVNDELFANIATHNIQIIVISSFILLLALVFQYKQTGISLENAKLYKALQEKQDVLDRDLRMARSVQQGLIPSEIPQPKGVRIAARCLPAESVGGDFYDFIEKENEVNLVIGDVSGHGVSSALVMALTGGIINELGRNHTAPGDLFTEVNRHIHHYLANNINFVTAFYARYELDTRTLSFSKAGHLPGLLFKKGAKKPIDLDGQGVLLGVFDDACFSTETVVLSSGDKVVLYTDGLTELRDPGGEWYGDERLTALISAHQDLSAPALLETIYTDVRKFSALQKDDQTMIILEIV